MNGRQQNQQTLVSDQRVAPSHKSGVLGFEPRGVGAVPTGAANSIPVFNQEGTEIRGFDYFICDSKEGVTE